LRTNVKTGTIICRSLEKAWKWSKAQREVAKSLDATAKPLTLLRWKKMVIEYKADRSKPNPFQETEVGE
jgi:hypothetical protein